MSENAHLSVTAITTSEQRKTEIVTPPRYDEQGTTAAADVPVTDGGTNSAPSPSQFFLASLSACKSMTAQVYAARKGFALNAARVTSRWVDAEGEEPARIDVTVDLEGELTDEERNRVLAVMEKCHVQQMIQAAPKIVSQLGTASPA